MFLLGSCKELSLNYSGCVLTHLSPYCSNKDCHCDQQYYTNNDCCSDIVDIGCHSNRTRCKTKSDNDPIHWSQLL